MEDLENILQSHKDKLAAALGCDGSLDILLLNAADRITQYRNALINLRSGMTEANNTNITDYIDSVLGDA